MPCYSPLKGWKDRETGGLVFRRDNAAGEMEVACGQCLGCRLDRSRMWAIRIAHEATLYEYGHGSCFVTLTYRDESECEGEQRKKGYFVPSDWSLNKKHFQDFMKRLRKHFPDRKIRFFHCGEYGKNCQHGYDLEQQRCFICNVGRPHYHACLFNVNFSDLEVYGSFRGEHRYTSPTLSRIWRYGFVDVGEVNFESAAYTARYALKKITGDKAEDYYSGVTVDGEFVRLQEEYCTMSRRPGIGRDWYEKFRDDVFPRDEIGVPGVGVVKKVPRYYEEIFKHEDAMTHEEIKAVRQKFLEEHAEEYTPQRLESKYKVKKAQISNLKRNL